MAGEQTPIAPPVKDLFYLGIDGTKAIDTVAWGHLWRETFKWTNLLYALNVDPANSSRRVDTAHAKLPIVQTTRTRGPDKFTEAYVAPEGDDGSGKDPKWPGSTPAGNVAEMSANDAFMQSFILNPRVDKAAQTLGVSGGTAGADIVFVSSHGFQTGDFVGQQGFEVAGVGVLFGLGPAVGNLTKFGGPKWLLLSNCNTLVAETHADWIVIMSAASTPLRGIVGFRDACPLADGSVPLFSGFIDQLKKGKTFPDAWNASMTANGLRDNWIVLCHEEAQADTILDWNADKLAPITKFSPPSIKEFTSLNPTGIATVGKPDPWTVFWSKKMPNGTFLKIDSTNRTVPANSLNVGDTFTITVGPPPGVATFPAGTKVSVTIIYIRVNYGQKVDVKRMFDVTATNNVKTPLVFSTINPTQMTPTNPAGSDKEPDSWILEADGTPATMELTLKCKDTDLNKLGHHNVLIWIGSFLDIPGKPRDRHRFIRNASVIAA